VTYPPALAYKNPKPLLQIFPCKNPSKIMIITSHMQKIIKIYPCLQKLSRKQDTFSKSVIFQPKTKIFPPKPLLQIFPCKNPSKIMIITSHMQKKFQIHPCLLKLSCKQESVTDRRTNSRYYYIPHRYHEGRG
jgi:hypothetical protein